MKGSFAEIRAKQALRAQLVAGKKPVEETKVEEPKPEEKPAEEPKEETKGDKVVAVPKKKKYMVADEAAVGKAD
jgi:hypothetical protein